MNQIALYNGMYGATEAEEAEALQTSNLPPELVTIAQVVGVAAGARANTPEELSAKIQNLQAMKQKLPFMALYYDNQIRKLKARRSALMRSERSSAQWRGLGQTAVGVGILFGVSLTALALSRAFLPYRPRRSR